MTSPPPNKAHSLRLAHSRRPVVAQETVIALFSVLVALLINLPFWERLAELRNPATANGALFFLLTGVCVTAVNGFLFGMLGSQRLLRPLLGATWLAGVVIAYYMSRYTVYLDASMLRNVLHSEPKEAGELVTAGMLATVLAACAPVWAILGWIKLRPRGWLPGLWRRCLWLAGCAVVAVVAAIAAYGDLSPLLRTHREVRYLVTPANLVAASLTVLRSEWREARQPREVIGLDARIERSADARPRLLVIVVGETVRAKSWGLAGYARDTTPALRERGVIDFADVSACGSNTEVSVPCMFAPVGRRDYDEARIRRQQSLLHVLEHAGIATRWLDNQTGCKGVCEGLTMVSIRGDEDPRRCDGTTCLDGVLYERAAREIAALSSAPGGRSDQVIVLHPLGNHGPAYSRRYPPEFRRFVPTCEAADLDGCDVASIRNSYDNAILYTDHLLAGLIDTLAARNDLDSAVVFVSDHGESLGERGLYLHGLPYAIAPDEQIKVPMFLWASSGWTQSTGLDQDCLRRKREAPISHDQLFHSVLGMLGVSTTLYERAYDLSASCRDEPRRVAAP